MMVPVRVSAALATLVVLCSSAAPPFKTSGPYVNLITEALEEHSPYNFVVGFVGSPTANFLPRTYEHSTSAEDEDKVVTAEEFRAYTKDAKIDQAKMDAMTKETNDYGKEENRRIQFEGLMKRIVKPRLIDEFVVGPANFDAFPAFGEFPKVKTWSMGKNRNREDQKTPEVARSMAFQKVETDAPGKAVEVLLVANGGPGVRAEAEAHAGRGGKVVIVSWGETEGTQDFRDWAKGFGEKYGGSLELVRSGSSDEKKRYGHLVSVLHFGHSSSDMFTELRADTVIQEIFTVAGRRNNQHTGWTGAVDHFSGPASSGSAPVPTTSTLVPARGPVVEETTPLQEPSSAGEVVPQRAEINNKRKGIFSGEWCGRCRRRRVKEEEKKD